MGSRALIVVTKGVDVARKRFGTDDGKSGVIFTRTGKAYFDNDEVEAAVIDRIIQAIDSAGMWQELKTDWILFDAELMPWSAKAQELIDAQYLTTAQAAMSSADNLLKALSYVGAPDDLSSLREKAQLMSSNAAGLKKVVNGYCWPVNGIDDYRVAPFHILAVEDRLLIDQPHTWHMKTLERLAREDEILTTTGWKSIDPHDENDRHALVDWWVRHTENGGEGLVLKPMDFTVSGSRGLIQPAMKVRGREYLRIIYGPDYDMPENIERLRERGLGKKFSMAEREFILGMEGLQRFLDQRPLADVHACALGILALESEPVDPRL